MKVLVKRFCYKGHTYTIIKDGGYTQAIDHRYLDENGCLTQKLNGLQMLVDLDDQRVSSMIERIKFRIDFSEYLAENGYDYSEEKKDMLLDLLRKFQTERFGEEESA